MINVAFRADSSYDIGTGHVNRCLSLAREFKKKKVKCVFFSNKQLGNINHLIKKEFDLYILNENHKKIFYSIKENFIDANLTIELIKKLKINFIFKDHYFLNSIWEKKILTYCKVVNISDFLESKSLCDYYINYNLLYENKLINKNLKKNCIRLIGPDYCIIKKIPNIKKKRIKKKITIFMGGADKKNYSAKLIKIFTDKLFLGYQVDIITGIVNKNLNSLAASIKKFKNFKIILGNKKNLYNLFLNSKLVITGLSTSMYEHLVLGTNSIVIVQNRLQKKVMKNLKELSFINFISKKKDLNKININNIMHNKNLISNNIYSKNIFKKDGSKRIVDYFVSKNITKNAKLIQASENDKMFLFKLFNEPQVLKNSFSNKKIDLLNHNKWFKKKLIDKNSKIFIFKTPIHNLGQVRFDKISNKKSILTYSVTNEFRGRKIASKMLSLALKMKTFNTDVYAFVKKKNDYSRKIFKKFKFIEMNDNKNQQFVTFYKNILRT